MGKVILFCVGLLMGTGLQGQDSDEEIIDLSPFVVTSANDEGYRSMNTVSGTGLDIAIRDLPMAMEVINAEFLEDTGAIDFQDALSYSSGVFTTQFTESSSGGRDGGNGPGANASYSRDRSASSRAGVGGRYTNSIIIRGFNVPFQNRDGFRYGGVISQYGVVLGGSINTLNVERLEVVKGPNSLLYGIGVLSGIVNVLPKRPLAEPKQLVSFSLGSEGFQHATVDVTGPLKKELWGGGLNYRFASSFRDADHWTDHRSSRERYYVAQLEYKSRKLSVFVEGQYIDSETNGVGSQWIYDNLSAAIDNGFRNEYGEQYSWTRDFGGFDEYYRVTGPDTYHNRLEKNFLVNLDYTPIENLTVSAGAFFTSSTEDRFNINVSTVTREERSLNLGDLRVRMSDPNLDPDEKLKIEEFFENTVEPFPAPPELNVPGRLDNNDYRVTRYFWSREPRATDTQQFRFRATYKRESELFGQRADHTLLFGRHDIRDIADFATGGTRLDYQYLPKQELGDNDPMIFRRVDDHSVIRYNGEMVAQPGREYHQVSVWYSGHYGLYQGRYLNDRLTLIAGLRHDRYESLDRVYDRNNPGGVTLRDNPNNETFGFIEGRDIRGPNADGADRVVTNLVSLGYRLNDRVTLYAMRAEGVTPNTGALDGNLKAIPSEQSLSKEVGAKFDFWDGRIAGSLSFYKIQRENAIWNWSNAPAPVKWVGGVVDPLDESDDVEGFNPEVVSSGEASIAYMVDSSYFDFEIGKITTIDPVTGRRKKDWPEGVQNVAGIYQGEIPPQDAVILQYDLLDKPAIDSAGNPTGHTWRHYIEKAFADREKMRALTRGQGGPDDIDPMPVFREKGTNYAINSSIGQVTGANVTYTDEATGFDFQVFLKPAPNWQVILNYAHTEREAISPFTMASVAPFGTEYDVWVRTFGRETFGLEEHDDDGDGVVDRVTKDGEPLTVGSIDSTDLVGGLQGTSLFFGSEDEFSFWTKYFMEFRSDSSLEFGLGGNYTGPAATSVAIGGSDLAANKFRTPSTAGRWKFDAMLRYRFKTSGGAKWSVTLNAYNIFNDRRGESVVQYDDNGDDVFRRSLVYYSPRSFRIGARVDF